MAAAATALCAAVSDGHADLVSQLVRAGGVRLDARCAAQLMSTVWSGEHCDADAEATARRERVARAVVQLSDDAAGSAELMSAARSELLLRAVPAWRDGTGSDVGKGSATRAPWLQNRAPWFWADQLTRLDAAGEVYLVRELLAEWEVDHVLARVAAMRSPVRPHATTVLSGWDSRGRVVDPVMVAVEERVANLTGIPPHGAEGMPRVTLTRPVGGVGEGSGGGGASSAVAEGSGADVETAAAALKNLHHDQNSVADDGRRGWKRRRAVTALVYLTDAENDGLVGGETLFPCVARDGSNRTTEDGEGSTCTRLAEAYSRGELELAMRGGFDEAAARDVSGMCGVSRIGGEDGGGTGLRVAPRRGWAVLFLSVRPDAPAEGLPHMWHGGCAVSAGEKWTLQVFKELPRVRELVGW